MSDDSESIILEVFEAVSAALNEFHLSMKTFSDAIILGKSPHASNRFKPSLKGLG